MGNFPDLIGARTLTLLSQLFDAKGCRVRPASWITATSLVLMIGVAAIAPVGASPAQASAPPAPGTPPSAPPVLPHMVPHPLSSFATQAARLPAGLRTAIGRDLHLTPQTYLAQSAAAVNAATVLAGLRKTGLDVSDSKMDGSTLVITVPTAADAAEVTSVGATAVVGPIVPDNRFDGLKVSKLSGTLQGGDGWAYLTNVPVSGDGIECTVGFNGANPLTGAAEFLTAGHCYSKTDTDWAAAKSNGFQLQQNSPQSAPGSATLRGADFGPMSLANFHYGTALSDYGLQPVNVGAWTLSPSTNTWSGGLGTPTTSVDVSGVTAGVVGASFCKSGSVSGWTCGTIEYLDQTVQVSGVNVNTIITTACAIPGDSGGPAMVGTAALGTLSGGDFANCAAGTTGTTVFYPLISPGGRSSTTASVGSTWKLTTDAGAPTVNPGGPLSNSTSVSGSAATTESGDTLQLYLNGSSTPLTTTIASNGSWSIPISGQPLGVTTYRAVVSTGQFTQSQQVTGTFAPVISRLSGVDRYATAVAIAQAAFPTTAPTVFIATGANYPDALSAAPVAAEQGGPLLLTPTASVPQNVVDEIANLHPQNIVVVGGTGAVSDAAYQQLASLVSDPMHITRVFGADRYSTSRQLISDYFSGPTQNVYVATGADFPDALSASAAAISKHAPVLLVPGNATSLDAATTALLTGFNRPATFIAGGTGAVSSQLETALTALSTSVTRYAGVDRYQTSQKLNVAAFPAATNIYLATGTGYPDALAGAVLAGLNDGPLFVTPPTCVSAPVLSEAATMGASNVTLFGGTGALSAAVQNLVHC
jgi:putative cell wall-binding protein